MNEINPKNRIILVDNQTDFIPLKEIIKEKTYYKIISFDYETHTKLTQENIPHENSDDFLNIDDIKQLQTQVYEFSKWCNQEYIKNEIIFDGLNIGNLFHEQIIDFLTIFLKKSHEVFIICNKNPNVTFIASGQIYTLVQNLERQVVLLKQKIESFSFVYDKIRIKIQIRNKLFTFLIPRSIYMKFKNIFDMAVHYFFKPRIEQNEKKNILFVEFPTDRFRELFLKSKNFSSSILFYGRRRPAFWNLDTFNIIFKSKTKILTPFITSNSNLTKTTNTISNEISSKIESLWLKNEFFEKYFYQNKISVWKFIKPFFVELIQKRISEISREIAFAKITFEKFNIHKVLVLQEIGISEQIVVNYAKHNGIPVSLLQIGLHYDTSEAKEANESQSVYPIKSDNFLVWGDVNEKDAIENAKRSPSSIIKVGAPRYDDVNVLEIPTDEKYVLLATSVLGHMHIRGKLTKNIDEYKKTISQICKIVCETQEQLIIKLHPSGDELNISDIAKKIDSNIKIVTTGDVLPLIKQCKVLIMVGLSTTIIESQLLQKPVIFIEIMDYGLGIPQVLKNNSCIVSSIDSLQENLIKLNSDNEFRRSVINNGNNFVKKYVSNINFASEKVLEHLTKN